VRRAWENGYYSVPILFNGNGLAQVILDEANWNAQGTSAYANAAYAAGMVNALKDVPGLLMWDVMNEPTHGNRWPSPPADEVEQAARRELVLAFARRAAAFVKSLDPGSPITFGCENVGVAEELADSVDVISPHDYGNSRTGREAVCRRVDALRERTGKPVIMNETGCPGHGNPYDMALEACWRHGFGWFFFDMFPYPNHREEHGVFYEDGTVRDPAAVCAMLGFFRNRDMETMNQRGRDFVPLALLRRQALGVAPTCVWKNLVNAAHDDHPHSAAISDIVFPLADRRFLAKPIRALVMASSTLSPQICRKRRSRSRRDTPRWDATSSTGSRPPALR
jgi:hypothetical protein